MRRCSNQITNYPSYDAALLKEDSLTEAGRAYQNLEGYYNEFVYSAYFCDLPVQLKSVFNELLGPAETGEGEAHADYAEAKQNILYLLTSGLHGYGRAGKRLERLGFRRAIS